MKPLAKLTLLRQRLYAKDCSEDTSSAAGGGGGNFVSGGGGSSKTKTNSFRPKRITHLDLI